MKLPFDEKPKELHECCDCEGCLCKDLCKEYENEYSNKESKNTEKRTIEEQFIYGPLYDTDKTMKEGD